MRLASFMHEAVDGFGVVEGERVLDVAPLASGRDLAAMLANPAEIAALAGRAEALPLSGVTLLPPIPRPPRIFCVGRNFRSGIARAGLEPPPYPILFARFAGTQVGHGEPIVRPSVSEQFDYEGEICVVIGTSARHVSAEEALAHVAGYTVFNDGSVRDYQRHTSQDTPGKNFWRSGSTGPWIVTRDEVPDPSVLRVETRLNGNLVQSGALDDLVFSVGEVVSYLSQLGPLEPGDHIAMGTPFGAGINQDPPQWLKPGDEVEVTVPQIGTLKNIVVDEAELA